MNNKLNEIIVSTLHLPPDRVTDELSMSEVETWDSLQHMNLIASLEEAFAVQLTFEEIVAMQSVGEIKRVLAGKGAEV